MVLIDEIFALCVVVIHLGGKGYLDSSSLEVIYASMGLNIDIESSILLVEHKNNAYCLLIWQHVLRYRPISHAYYLL